MICKRKVCFVLAVCFLVICLQSFHADAATQYSGTCGEKLKWQISYDTLYISGKGDMYNYDTSNKAPWHQYKYEFSKINIYSGATSIGEYAFYGLSATEVSIPSSVKVIGKAGFYCSGLVEVDIPNGVEKIGRSAFYQCLRLREVTIPASVKEMEGDPFYGSRALAAINVDPQNPSYLSIDGVLFDKDCSVLLHYPVGNPRDSYTVPDGVTTIGRGSFADDQTSLEVIFPNSVTTIENNAFRGCEKMKSITLPAELSFLGDFAFLYCFGLTDITFMGPPPEFDCGADGDQFYSVDDATVYYPDVEAWDESVRLDYGGTLTWVEYAHDHIEKTVEAVEPTCEGYGQTEHSYCVVCHKDILAAETIPPLGHAEKKLPVVYPTLTSTGLTEGVYCSRCEKVLVPQEIIPIPETQCSIYLEEADGGGLFVIVRNNDITPCNIVLVVVRYSDQGQMLDCSVKFTDIQSLDGISVEVVSPEEGEIRAFVADGSDWEPLCESRGTDESFTRSA